MGRQVRRVPADWQHPRNPAGRLIPMRQARDSRARASDAFMPDWPPELRTHWQLYEVTTAGTPLSPPCASAADWRNGSPPITSRRRQAVPAPKSNGWQRSSAAGSFPR
jgi:hypothetical protein